MIELYTGLALGERFYFLSPIRMKNRLGLILGITLAVCVCFVLVCYSLYTNEIWEDSLITLRFAKNLIDGKGLVYNAGERIHGFTSPLGVLLLAFSYLVTNRAGDIYLFWMYRAICILFFAVGAVFLTSPLLDRDKKSFLPMIFLALFYVFDAKTVSFTINGMETVFMLFFLAAYIYIIYKGLSQLWIPAGICWAGLMWTRPDSFFYIAALAVSYILFSGSKKDNFIIHLKMTAICVALYLPWLICAWIYYGSPVPQTILAKLHYSAVDPWMENIRVLLGQIQGPIYYHYSQSSWPFWIERFFLAAQLFAITYWLFPAKDKLVRVISLSCFFVFLYYFCLVNYFFPWYFPPLKMMSSFVLVKGLFELINRKNRILVYIILIPIFFTSSYVFLLSATQRRVWQAEIEEGNRKQIGLWLKDHMSDSERAYAEPLGYIGYFSNKKILDFPGLVSPEVTELMNRDKRLNFYMLIPKLEPEWLVLRDYNVDLSKFEYLNRNYSRVMEFDIRSRLLRNYNDIAGIESVLYDARYVIFKKVTLP